MLTPKSELSMVKQESIYSFRKPSRCYSEVSDGTKKKVLRTKNGKPSIWMEVRAFSKLL